MVHTPLISLIFMSLLNTSLITASDASKSTCQLQHSQPPLIGQRCVTDNKIYTKRTGERHHCTLFCICDPGCQVINFNITGSYCLLGQRSCAHLENDVDFVTTLMTSNQPCLKWDSNLENNLYNIVPFTNTSSAVVVRGNREGNKIPGKWPTESINIYYSWNGQETSPLKEQAEILTVSPGCTINWVFYDSTSRNPLPAGAVHGGHLNGIPLYVARKFAVFIKGHPPVFAAGYYDNVNGLGHLPYDGLDHVFNEVEILVLPGWYG